MINYNCKLISVGGFIPEAVFHIEMKDRIREIQVEIGAELAIELGEHLYKRINVSFEDDLKSIISWKVLNQ